MYLKQCLILANEVHVSSLAPLQQSPLKAHSLAFFVQGDLAVVEQREANVLSKDTVKDEGNMERDGCYLG